MVNVLHTVVCLLILQIYVSAAPSNITSSEETNAKLDEPSEEAKLEVPSDVIPEEPKLDQQPDQQELREDSKVDDKSSQNPRQKRFYNFYGYGPPINPVVYPSYNKRDQSAETGVYGYIDPLEQIQRKLHDIASFVNQPVPPPPPPSHFPFYFPVIYIPQYGCDCNTHNPPPQPETPQTQTPKPDKNQTDPDPDKRFPDLNDERQNWGFVTNETESEYDEDEFARPISFDPIEPNRPLMRPAPPVNHGTNEGTVTSTTRPTSPPRRPPPQNRPPSQGRPISSPGQFGSSTPYPSSFGNDIPRNEQPSTCDGAVLSCCHQPYLTYECFASQGCPDLTSYGDPCDPLGILKVVEKFQKFYGMRNGN